MRSFVLQFRGTWDQQLHLVEFSYNNNFQASIGMGLYEALYGKHCRTPLCWSEVGDKWLTGPEIIRQTAADVQNIRDRLKAAQDRQKSYADTRRKDLEFEVGDQVFLKLSPWKGVVRFGKRGKLRPRYIGPYEITQRMGVIAYQLALPTDMSRVHDVFHMSMLWKYVADPSHILTPYQLPIREDLTYIGEPAQVLDQRVQQLRNKAI